MNEIPIAFNLSNNITVKQYSTRTVSILSTNYEHFNFTVVLTYIANETKLPSVIIFKLINVSRKKFSDSIIIHINKKG